MSATSNPLFTTSATAGTNVTKNRFVKEAAGGIVNRCTAAGEKAHGVALHTVESGAAASVQKKGVVVLEAGAIVADNVTVMTDSVGRAVLATTGLLILGKVVNGSSAGAAGDLISVELFEQPTVAA